MQPGAYSTRFKQMQREHIDSLKYTHRIQHGDLTTTTKRLHVETTKRRKAMAVKRKNEVDKEEIRRQEILAKRREEIRSATERFQRLNKNYVRKTEEEIKALVNQHCHERAQSPASLDEVLKLVNGRPSSSTSHNRGSVRRLQRSQSLENTFPVVRTDQSHHVPAATADDTVVLHQFTSPGGYHFMQVKNSRIPSATPVISYVEQNHVKKPASASNNEKQSIKSRALLEKHMEHEETRPHVLNQQKINSSDAHSNALHVESPPVVTDNNHRPTSKGSIYSTYDDSLEVRETTPVHQLTLVPSHQNMASTGAGHSAVKLSYQTVRPPSRGTSPSNVAVVQPQPSSTPAAAHVRPVIKPHNPPVYRETEACAGDYSESDKSDALYDSLDETSQALKDESTESLSHKRTNTKPQETIVNFVTSQTADTYPSAVEPTVTAYMNHGAHRKAWITPSDSDIGHFTAAPHLQSMHYSSVPAASHPKPLVPPNTYIDSFYQNTASPIISVPTNGSNNPHASALAASQYSSVQYTVPTNNMPISTFATQNNHGIPTNVKPQATAPAMHSGGMSAVLTGPSLQNGVTSTTVTGTSTYDAQAYTENDPIKQLESMPSYAIVNTYINNVSNHPQGSMPKVVYGGYGYSHPKESAPTGSQSNGSRTASGTGPVHQLSTSATPVYAGATSQGINPAVTSAASQQQHQDRSKQDVSSHANPSRIPRPKNPSDYTNTIDDFESDLSSLRPPSPVFKQEEEEKQVQLEIMSETQSEPCTVPQQGLSKDRVIKGILKKKPSSASAMRTTSEEVHTAMKRSMSASAFGTRDSVELTRSHRQHGQTKSDTKSNKKTVRFSDVELYEDDVQPHTKFHTKTYGPSSKPPIPTSTSRNVHSDETGAGNEENGYIRPHPPSKPPSGRAIMNNSNIVRQQLAHSKVKVNLQPAPNQFVNRQREATGSGVNDFRSHPQQQKEFSPDKIPLDKTPTDEEINKLWEKVQGYLHKQSASPRDDDFNGATQNGNHGNGVSHEHNGASHMSSALKTKYMDGSSLIPTPYNRHQRASSATTYSAANRAVPKPRVASAHGPFPVRRVNMDTLTYQNKRQGLLNQRKPKELPVFGAHPYTLDGYSVQTSVHPLAPSQYDISSHQSTTAHHGQHNSMSESLAAFVAAEHAAQHNQSVTQSQLEAAMREGQRDYLQQTSQRQHEPSALSIEERNLIQSLERLDERLKVVTNPTLKSAAPAMPRPPSHHYPGFRGKAIHIPVSQALKKYANPSSAHHPPREQFSAVNRGPQFTHPRYH